MPWTDAARREHRREGAGYPSDLRDAEWELIGKRCLKAAAYAAGLIFVSAGGTR